MEPKPRRSSEGGAFGGRLSRTDSARSATRAVSPATVAVGRRMPARLRAPSFCLSKDSASLRPAAMSSTVMPSEKPWAPAGTASAKNAAMTNVMSG
ncbi:MAG: hypothetical protein HYV15_04310 [Elusimicrobia bacterium]|nr:hypothetical protein [Elusimicrobiota bacterium]